MMIALKADRDDLSDPKKKTFDQVAPGVSQLRLTELGSWLLAHPLAQIEQLVVVFTYSYPEGCEEGREENLH